jgi:hypothetical protein
VCVRLKENARAGRPAVYICRELAGSVRRDEINLAAFDEELAARLQQDFALDPAES